MELFKYPRTPHIEGSRLQAGDEDLDAVDLDVIAEARELARTYLRQHKSFVWNATNVTRSRRGRLIDLFIDYGARVRIIYLEVPPAEVLRRNRERERVVPEGVIWNMAAHLELPEITEAHHVDWIVQASNC
jgi:predicted kinase